MTTEMQSVPVLKNSRHELFAKGLFGGMSAIEAYENAGYKPDTGAASRLSAKVSVRERVAELQAKVTAKAIDVAAIDKAYLMRRLVEIGDAAVSAGQNSAAVAAIRELGVLTGDRIERAEQGQPGTFDSLTEDEIARREAENERKIAALDGSDAGAAPRKAAAAGRTDPAARRKVGPAKQTGLH